MIIQTAPSGQPRLAIMMYEHTALAYQFARAFGNNRFEAADPFEWYRMSCCITTPDEPNSIAIR